MLDRSFPLLPQLAQTGKGPVEPAGQNIRRFGALPVTGKPHIIRELQRQMRTETEHTIFLKDYAAEPVHGSTRSNSTSKIGPETSRVRALLDRQHRVPGTEPGTPLVLDGDELKLDSIAIDGFPLQLTAYETRADRPDHPPSRRTAPSCSKPR